MKKLISVFMVLAMAFSLAACGNENAGGESSDTKMETSVQPAAEEQETSTEETDGADKKALVVYFSATGNTKAVAETLAELQNADIYEIVPEQPYTDDDLDYSDKNTRATKEQNDTDARPAISGSIENFEQYETVYVGYPIWWASIPMPIASFLEEYDFSGKTIIPFCSHGGGRFGQSLTAIEKLAPDAVMGEGLSVHYSGDSSLDSDIREWLGTNKIKSK